MASSSPGVRPWRTAFLTLRDETLTSPPPSAILSLLRCLILSQSVDALATAAIALPTLEVTSDVMLLLELASTASGCQDASEPLLQICHLVHDVTCRIRLELNSSSWSAMVNFVELVVEIVLSSANKGSNLCSDSRLKAVSDISAILRLTVKVYGRHCSMSETKHLARVLLCVISCLNSEMLSFYYKNSKSWYASDVGSTKAQNNSIWEIQTTVLSLLSDALSKIGASISEDLWHAVVEDMRKLMDFLASKNLVIVDSIMSRFFATLFHLLHLILSIPKGSLSAHVRLSTKLKTLVLFHVASFVTTLQMFFAYGLPSRSSFVTTCLESKNKEISSANLMYGMKDPQISGRVPYKPPHLRRREETKMHLLCDGSSSDYDSCRLNLLSSDSDHSDGDITPNDGDRYRSSKARLAAVLCIQDLCIAEPKSISSLWTLLLPENDVLQPRYSRMPENLLWTTVASVKDWIMNDLTFKTEHVGLMGTALSCLGAALSKSPPSANVLKMLEKDISGGCSLSQHDASVIHILIHLSGLGKHQAITFEALQALKAASHNYPSILFGFWEQISSIAYRLLQTQAAPEVSGRNAELWKGDTAKVSGTTTDKCIMASMKVVDEFLRVSSGFKGADDLLECRLLDIQHMSNTTKEKRISSAPYVFDIPDSPNQSTSDFSSGVERWSEVIERHMPLAICHCAPVVRAAALTCFAGLTSSVFCILNGDMQEFIISSVVTAALSNDTPPVKSAACRAIGVVRVTASWALANICDSLRRSAIELHLELHAVDTDEFEPISLLVETALRLTKDGDKIKSNAVRALGHLSRFLRFNYCSTVNETSKVPYHSSNTAQNFKLFEDKACRSPSMSVSSSDFSGIQCGDSQWLVRMVQAFLSCVTTGNVKVQWNVCYALSNLFMNDSLRLYDMPWAPTVYSILLLLLRDSTNYKIRIHAAVALAVPSSRLDYGNSFSDVVQGLQHVLESLCSYQSLTSSSFKYKDNLEKQLNLTTLHVLGFVSPKDGPVLKDFLMKKANFLEGWFKFVCSSLIENQNQPSTSIESSAADGAAFYMPKKAMVQKALKSLHELYKFNNLYTIAVRFEKLISSYP
ncbi:hypothetical protein AXF42_Ash007004 [Apostasia shenzhenica]|uniref:DUF4042 domain-containing protein n=1 Tax=Apostasia shenzhenica TaxID=1088818 RepID=A0A2I0BES5_9ASPA|nr:hypothetical protein AXF42_Ash007004 [Apostasia shenzhenica]